MALTGIADMTNSGALRNRIVACAAARGKDQRWANENLYAVCATDGWHQKWDAAMVASVGVGDLRPNLGVRTDVISDEDIATAVQALIDQQAQDAEAAKTEQDQRIAELEAKVAELQQRLDDTTAAGSPEGS